MRLRKAKSEPHVNTMAAEEAEARKLGLSYGTYIAFRDTGYLDTYIKGVETKNRKNVNIIESNLHAGSGGRKRAYFPRDKLG